MKRESRAEKQEQFGKGYEAKPKSARERKAQKEFFNAENNRDRMEESMTMFAGIIDETNRFLLSENFLNSIHESWKKSEKM